MKALGGPAMNDKAYSVDGEKFFEREELIDWLMGKHHIKNRQELVGLEYHEGDKTYADVRSLIDIDSIINIMSENAWEIGGEWAEDWPDLSEEEKSELENLIVDFLKKKSPVNFFRVENIVRKIMTADDIKEQEAELEKKARKH
jgi:hypothetical protein